MVPLLLMTKKGIFPDFNFGALRVQRSAEMVRRVVEIEADVCRPPHDSGAEAEVCHVGLDVDIALRDAVVEALEPDAGKRLEASGKSAELDASLEDCDFCTASAELVS